MKLLAIVLCCLVAVVFSSMGGKDGDGGGARPSTTKAPPSENNNNAGTTTGNPEKDGSFEEDGTTRGGNTGGGNTGGGVTGGNRPTSKLPTGARNTTPTIQPITGPADPLNKREVSEEDSSESYTPRSLPEFGQLTAVVVPERKLIPVIPGHPSKESCQEKTTFLMTGKCEHVITSYSASMEECKMHCTVDVKCGGFNFKDNKCLTAPIQSVCGDTEMDGYTFYEKNTERNSDCDMCRSLQRVGSFDCNDDACHQSREQCESKYPGDVLSYTRYDAFSASDCSPDMNTLKKVFVEPATRLPLISGRIPTSAHFNVTGDLNLNTYNFRQANQYTGIVSLSFSTTTQATVYFDNVGTIGYGVDRLTLQTEGNVTVVIRGLYQSELKAREIYIQDTVQIDNPSMITAGEKLVVLTTGQPKVGDWSYIKLGNDAKLEFHKRDSQTKCYSHRQTSINLVCDLAWQRFLSRRNVTDIQIAFMNNTFSAGCTTEFTEKSCDGPGFDTTYSPMEQTAAESCQCKIHIDASTDKCDTCKEGFSDLTEFNPNGCLRRISQSQLNDNLVEPSHYNIKLDLGNLSRNTFEGWVTINVDILKPVDVIILNAKMLDIRLVKYTSESEEHIPYVHVDALNDRIYLKFEKFVEVNKGTLTIFYTGHITGEQAGLYDVLRTRRYNSNKIGDYVLMTHLYPNHARRLFPSWDEPKYMATFSLTLTFEGKTISAISNTPGTKSHESETTTVVFEKTEKIAPHLFGFAVGDFESSISGRVTVVTTKLHADKYYDSFKGMARFYDTKVGLFEGFGQSAKNVTVLFVGGIHGNLGESHHGAALNLVFVAVDYLGIRTPHKSPNNNIDFFHDDVLGGDFCRKYVLQWFGSSVHFSSWYDYTYMANAISSWASGSCGPESFLLKETQNPPGHMRSMNFPPFEVSVIRPDLFDRLAYPTALYVSQTMMKMLEHWLTADYITDGIRNFINMSPPHNSLGLFAEWDMVDDTIKLAKNDVLQVILSGTRQRGVPLISVTKTGDVVVISQMPYESEYSRFNSDKRWAVPISYQNMDGQKTILLRENNTLSMPIPRLATNDYILLNEGYFGRYITLYDNDLLNNLRNNFDKIASTDKLVVLSDLLFTYKGHGDKRLGRVLPFLTAYKNDSPDNFDIWFVIDHFLQHARGLIQTMEKGDSDIVLLTKFDVYVNKLYKLISEKVETKCGNTENSNTPSLIGNCAALKRMFMDTLKIADTKLNVGTDNDVDLNLEHACSRVSNEEPRSMEWLKAMYVSEWKEQTHKFHAERIVVALSCVNGKNMTLEYLDWALTTGFVDVAVIFVSRRSYENRIAAWYWIINNWEKIIEKLKSSTTAFEYDQYHNHARYSLHHIFHTYELKHDFGTRYVATEADESEEFHTHNTDTDAVHQLTLEYLKNYAYPFSSKQVRSSGINSGFTYNIQVVEDRIRSEHIIAGVVRDLAENILETEHGLRMSLFLRSKGALLSGAGRLVKTVVDRNVEWLKFERNAEMNVGENGLTKAIDRAMGYLN